MLVLKIDEDTGKAGKLNLTPAVEKLIDIGMPSLPAVLPLMLADDSATRERAETKEDPEQPQLADPGLAPAAVGVAPQAALGGGERDRSCRVPRLDRDVVVVAHAIESRRRREWPTMATARRLW